MRASPPRAPRLDTETERRSTSRPGRPEAARIVWNWNREGERSELAGERAAAIRRRGVIQTLLAAAIGSAIFYFVSHTVAYVIFTIATIVGLSALLSPTGLFAAIEGAFNALGQALGGGVSWGLLALIFYGFFLPFGLLFRSGRRDSMKRFFEPDASSYWVGREAAPADPTSYRRQF
jgi:hypothetical protein